MISKVNLRNFKCYREYEFELASLSVFCGNNSVGKSTVIQSILMAIQGDFSDLGLPFNGEFVEIGKYSDLHKRNENEDTVYFKIGNDKGLRQWGYELDDLKNTHYDNKGYDERLLRMKEQPLPLICSEGDNCVSIQDCLINNFQYLCAERLGPKHNYPYSAQRRSKNWLGIQGEYSAQVLSAITELHGDENKLSENDPRRHVNSATTSIPHNIQEWMGVISPSVFINSSSIETANIATTLFEFAGEKYRPINVGFGLSYALPVVMALLLAKPGGLVIIENPEAHLHPRGQSYLGRLIALTALAGVQVIIETHSDHLLNGMRVISRLNDNYQDGTFKVFYVYAGEEQSEVEEISIGDKGELTSWPKGFFDQQSFDVRTLMKGIDQQGEDW